MINNLDEKPIKTPEKKESKVFSWGLYGEMMTEFAVVIALPLIIFLFLDSILGFFGLDSAADWAKRNHKENQLYNVIGIFTAIFISFYAIIKKIMAVKKLLKQ